MPAYQFHNVGQFHHRFGLDNTTYGAGPGPRELPDDLLQFRIKFIFEELQELLEGMGYEFTHSIYSTVMMGAPLVRDLNKVNEAQQFDALMDMVYVIYGLAHLKGYPWEEGWIRVQRANMAKERATSKTASERGGTWDVVKPEGWTPPDIEGLLKEWGW